MSVKTRMLDCQLTRDELIERGHALTVVIDEIDGLEAEKKAFNDSIKSKMTARETRLAELASVVRNKKEKREVEITQEKDWGRKIEETIRLDTGEVIETRVLTPQELQMEFDRQERSAKPGVVLEMVDGFDHSPKVEDASDV